MNMVRLADLMSGVREKILDSNKHYRVSLIWFSTGIKKRMHKILKAVKTFYILEGGVELELYNADFVKIGTKIFTSGSGWSLLPGQAQKLTALEDSMIFAVRASACLDSLVDKTGFSPIEPDKINEFSGYLVKKPWGSEQWLVENGVFVLKGITMNTGTQCSIQLHEQKVEINFVLNGIAKLFMFYDEKIEQAVRLHRESGKEQSSFSVSEESFDVVRRCLRPELITKYHGWKVKPFEIHTVLSLNTYFALEVSTPEVDDVIRFKDLYDRKSGKIKSEHEQNKFGREKI